MSPRAVGLVSVSLAACSWGTWPLFVRGGGQSGLVVGFITMAVMAAPSVALLRRFHLRDRGALVALAIIGVADAANVALYFSALEAGPVVVAVMTHYLAPVLVALAAPVLVNEPRSRRALLALPAILVGLFFVLPSGAAGGGWERAALAGGGSAVFYAALVLATRRAAVSFPPLAVTSFHAVLSAALLLVVFRERALPSVVDGGVALLIVGAAVNGLLGAFLFNFGLPRIGAQLTGVLTYLEPLVASLVGAAFLGEGATLLTATGLVVMLGAGAFMASEPPPTDRPASG